MYIKAILAIITLFPSSYISQVFNGNTNAVNPFAQWRTMDFIFPTPAMRQQAISSKNFVPENIILIDVGVDYKNPLQYSRIFVTMPRFRTGVPASLGYITAFNSLVQPYPAYNWHSSHGKDCNGITSAFRVAFDGCNRMWVIDSGRIGDNQLCQPQLLIFDLATDVLLKRYKFDNTMYSSSSIFANPVLDVADPGICRNVKAYIADVTVYNLIVYDLLTDRAWKVTNNLFRANPAFSRFTIAGESFDLMDGILGMSVSKFPLGQDSERSLLFHALASETENSVPLSVLNNPTIWQNNPNAMPNAFKVIGKRGIQTGAEAMDRNGNLYFVLLKPLALVCWDSSTSYKPENFRTLYSDDTTLQFASGLKVVTNLNGEEELWMVTNRLQKFMTRTVNTAEINYRILVANIGALLYPYKGCRTNNQDFSYPVFPFYRR